jgi:hypothetical protein
MILPPFSKVIVDLITLEKLAFSWCCSLLTPSPTLPLHDVPRSFFPFYNHHHHSFFLTTPQAPLITLEKEK